MFQGPQRVIPADKPRGLPGNVVFSCDQRKSELAGEPTAVCLVHKVIKEQKKCVLNPIWKQKQNRILIYFL